MRFAAILIAALASAQLHATAEARTWYVRPDSTGDAPTIQAAMDSASVGDEVVLAPGTYSWTTQGGMDDPEFGPSMIEVRPGVSLRGEAGAESTILDAEGYPNGRVILCRNVGEVRIEGLTVAGGSLTGDGPQQGGGICSVENSSSTISDCVVRNNDANGAEAYGVGIYAARASIIGCEVFDNSLLGFGNGVGIFIGEGSVAGSIIRNNSAGSGPGSGVGIYAERTSITDCEVLGNSGGPLGDWRGAGITIRQGSVSGCIIRGNSAFTPTGGGILAWDTTISDCWIEGNSVYREYTGEGRGGGVNLEGGSITRCTFIRNNVSAELSRGGAISCTDCDISDCVFVGNVVSRTETYGGAISCWDCRITYCFFAGNWAGGNVAFGGAIAAYGQATIASCTLVENSAGAPPGEPAVAGIYLEGTGSVSRTIVAFNEGQACSGPITFSCSNLFGNSLGDSLCGIDAGGNFSADPQFCDEAPVTSLNFALQSSSPCAPGNHPDGISCGLIGAAPVGCPSVSSEATTWSRLKSLFR